MWIPVSPLVTLTIAMLFPADTAPTAGASAPPPAMTAPAHAPAPVAPPTSPKTPDMKGNVPAAQPAAPAPTDPKLDGVVDAMQKVYDGTTEFTGNFTQKYTYTLLRRTQESKGSVKFKKPGLMRWDYAAPAAKAFVVDGKSLWVYQPEDKNAFVNACFQQDGLTASVAFLWGQGKIKEQFGVAWFKGVFGEATDNHLELTPKKPNAVFAKLIIVVDPKTSRVKQSIVVDPSGNVNQFIYNDLKFNSGLGAKDFSFTPPTGTHVARMPGSCDAPIAGVK